MGKENKYTPGPWKVKKFNPSDGSKGWFEIQFGDDGECLAEVIIEESDAKLIAAAPELLEALEAMYNFYEEIAMRIPSDEFNEKFRDLWNPIMSNTEKVIEKATK